MSSEQSLAIFAGALSLIAGAVSFALWLASRRIDRAFRDGMK